MKKSVMFASLIALSVASSGYACGVQGTAVNSDGSKIDGSGTISTSWNGEKAFPRDGTYSLDLGSNVCGEEITVYLDGNDGHTVRVEGWTTVNFVRR